MHRLSKIGQRSIFIGLLVLSCAAFASAGPPRIEGVPTGPEFWAPMTFKLGPPPIYNDRQRIYAVGSFDAGTANLFTQFLRTHSIGPGTVVVFHSPGGLAEEGIRVGGIIRAHYFDTTVAQHPANGQGGLFERIDEPGVCASSCSLAYLGGVNRRMLRGSLYGVHDLAGGAVNKNDDLLDLGQKVAGELSEYITSMGASPNLLTLLTKFNSSKNEVFWMPADLMAKMRVTTQASTVWRTDWHLEDSKAGFALVGRNTEASSVPNNFEKVVFACTGVPRRVLLGGYYMPAALFGDAEHPLRMAPAAFPAFVTGYSISVLADGANRYSTIRIPKNAVVEPAKVFATNYVSAFVVLTPELQKLLPTAETLIFQFNGFAVANAGGVKVDFAPGREQALQFIDNCR